MIWVEILSRHRDVVARHRLAGAEIRIGRGYGNDLVIDDPFVAREHLRIFRDGEGRLIAEDLNTVNGTFLDHATERSGRIAVDGEHPIRIGHTLLRIREPGHAVAAERVAEPAARAWPLIAGLLACLFGIELLSVWLGQTTEPKPSQYLTPPLIISVVLAVWTMIWCILCRIFDGQAHLERNLLIAIGGTLVFSLWNEFAWVSGFAFASRLASQYQYLVQIFAIAVVCFLHLRVLGPRRLWLKGAAVGILAVAAVALQALNVIEGAGRSVTQMPNRRLMPPEFRVAAAQAPDAFLAEIGKLKTKLDRDRGTDPEAGDGGEDDED